MILVNNYSCFAALLKFIKAALQISSSTIACVDVQHVFAWAGTISSLRALFCAVEQYVRVFDGGQPAVDHPRSLLNVMVPDKAEAKHMLIYIQIYIYVGCEDALDEWFSHEMHRI